MKELQMLPDGQSVFRQIRKATAADNVYISRYLVEKCILVQSIDVWGGNVWPGYIVC